MEHLNLEKSINEINRMANRLVIAIVIASLVVGSSLVINADVGPRIMNIPAIGFVGYFSAAVFGFYIIISILRSGKM
jgi:ubiquinone biosynthesis protein